MRLRWIPLLALLALFVIACDGDDPELSTESTIVTGGTGGEPSDGNGATTTTAPGNGENGASPSTTLAGEQVSEYRVVREIPNDNGVAQHIVIPDGAYTDIDLENFVIDLLEANPDLFGAQIFGSNRAARVFRVPQADRTNRQDEVLANDWYVSLQGRARIVFRGPFSEFGGGAIGS